jgi:hypothetical protein
MIAKKILGDGESTGDGLTVEDCFSTYVYDGTGMSQQIKNGINLVGEPANAVDRKIVGSFNTTIYTGNSSTQDIVNGVDLATDGGMVWTKCRNNTIVHGIFDTERTLSYALSSNDTQQETIRTDAILSYNTNGFTLGNSNNVNWSDASYNKYVAWTFKKEAKFFDVVKYTGNGVAGREIAHNLGCDVGMIVVKNLTSGTAHWNSYHKDLTSDTWQIRLDLTSAEQNIGVSWNPTTTTFTPQKSGNADNSSNEAGQEYIAYLFAHDTAADSMIKCGSYEGNGSTDGPEIDLGFEPQYLMIKCSTETGNWYVNDNIRGLGEQTWILYPNTSGVEEGGINYIDLQATGFKIKTAGSAYNATGETYIYMAIRKPQYDGSSGGMVWTKDRDSTYDHAIQDTENGLDKVLYPSYILAAGDEFDSIISLNTNGYIIGDETRINKSAKDYVSWTFRKAPRFFDVVKYTGNGVAGREIPHELGCDVGMIIVKKLNSTFNWLVYHRSTNMGYYAYLNFTDAFTGGSNLFWHSAPTSSVFNLGSHTGVNGVGDEYIAYLFAHNETDGLVEGDGKPVIKCGSFTTDGSGNASVDLGFEPQYLMVKSSIASDGWHIVDSTRALAVHNGSYNGVSDLQAQASSAETQVAFMQPTSTGFETTFFAASRTYIYMAIARDTTTVPTSSDEVFAIDTKGSTGDGKAPAFRSGFPVDAAMFRVTSNAYATQMVSRLTGTKYLETSTTGTESTDAWYEFDYMNGYINNTSTSTTQYSWMFRRQKSFFDVVTYTGDGIAGRTVNHNLGVVPSVIWVKARTSAQEWAVYHVSLGNNNRLWLNSDSSSAASSAYWDDSSPIDSNFTLGATVQANASSVGYIAYLFGDLAGVSSSFTFTADGTKNIDLGFTTGVKWMWLKRTDSSGDFIMVDVVRGLDNYLCLNNTNAQTSGSGISQHTNGFTSSINDGGTYVGWAIANEI